MRRAKGHIPSKREAVLGGALTAVLGLIFVSALDHWDDGLSWSEALRSETFYWLFMLVWMSAFFYFWPRWMAKRGAAKS